MKLRKSLKDLLGLEPKSISRTGDHCLLFFLAFIERGMEIKCRRFRKEYLSIYSHILRALTLIFCWFLGKESPLPVPYLIGLIVVGVLIFAVVGLFCIFLCEFSSSSSRNQGQLLETRLLCHQILSSTLTSSSFRSNLVEARE